jgi:histidine phosphotransfer protein HptB
MTGMLEHDEPLYSTLAQDPDLCDIVELFVEEMPGRVAALVDGMSVGDWEQLRRTVHQIKGAAGSYGFAPITQSAAQLEDLIRHSRPEDEIRQAVDELIGLCRRAQTGASG